MRCLIIDDSQRFLAVAADHLSRTGLDVAGSATTREEALRLTEWLRPDVVLVDISLGDDSGFEITRHLVEAFPQLKGRVVLISTRDPDDLVDLIAASPAAGYIPKNLLSTERIVALLEGAEL